MENIYHWLCVVYAFSLAVVVASVWKKKFVLGAIFLILIYFVLLCELTISIRLGRIFDATCNVICGIICVYFGKIIKNELEKK